MAGIRKLAQLLQEHGDEFLVLDFNHLFISSTLREEIWLLRHRDDTALANEVLEQAKGFGIVGAGGDRELSTYSGGEQALLACLLVIAVIKANGCRERKVLLHDVQGSLSQENWNKLLASFSAVHASHGLRLFVNEQDQVREVAIDNQDHEGHVQA